MEIDGQISSLPKTIFISQIDEWMTELCGLFWKYPVISTTHTLGGANFEISLCGTTLLKSFKIFKLNWLRGRQYITQDQNILDKWKTWRKIISTTIIRECSLNICEIYSIFSRESSFNFHSTSRAISLAFPKPFFFSKSGS